MLSSPTILKALSCVVFAALGTGCAKGPLATTDWLELRTRHFVITSALDLKETIQLGEDLENFRAGIEFLLADTLSPPPIRTRVYAFDGRTIVRPFDWRGESGYSLPSLDGATIVLRTGGGWRHDATDKLRFEYTRFLMRNREGLDLPLWYDEGFGLFASTLEVEDKSIDVGLPRPEFVVRLRDRLELSLPRLIQIQDLTTLGLRERETFDAESWAFVHYLAFQTGTPGRLQHRFARYFERIGQGVGYPEALEQAFGKGPDALERALSRYVRERSFDAIKVAIHVKPGHRKANPQPLPTTRALSRLGWLAIRLERPGRARPYFQRALSLDPGNASAVSGLAAADRLDGQWESAQAFNARALALAPRDPLVQLEVGRYHAARAANESRPGPRAEEIKLARKHYEASTAEFATNPEAYARLGSTYLLPGQDANKAIPLLDKAQALLPSSLEIELLRARAEFALGRASIARYLATSVASRTLDSAVGQKARRFLDEIGGSEARQPSPLRQPRTPAAP